MDKLIPIKNPNHPRKGAAIKVEPIRKMEDIEAIKQLLKPKPRDYCLFVMGINTAYRAIELVSLTVGQVAHLQAGDILDIKQSKNRRYRATTLNNTVIEAIQHWLAVHPNKSPDAPLFISRNTGQSIRANTINKMVKQWCHAVHIYGNYGSHTLRKTFGYQKRVRCYQPLVILMVAFGHASEQQTLEYLCIQSEEVSQLYREVI